MEAFQETVKTVGRTENVYVLKQKIRKHTSCAMLVLMKSMGMEN